MGGGMSIKEALAFANREVQKKIDAALSNEVFDVLAETESAAIDETVYDAYDPKMYRRRGMYGGMADPDNIEIAGGKATAGRLEVINTTEPNPGGVFAKGKVTTGKNLPLLIEYGDGYKGNRYDFRRGGSYLKPRRFTKETIERLKASKRHKDALADGLRSRGLKIEE